MKTKQIAFLLILALVLSSCGIIIINNRETEQTDTDSDNLTLPFISYDTHNYPVIEETDYESEAMERLSSLPQSDFNGYSVFITVENTSGFLFDEEEDAVYRSFLTRRSYNLSNRFNFKSLVFTESTDTIRTEMSKAKKSGDHYTDIAIIPQNRVCEMATSKLLRNLKTLPHIDFESECYDQNSIKAFTFGTSLYGIVGSLVDSPERYTAVYYNVSTLGAPDYNLIRDGRFTVEKLNLIQKNSKTASSIDKDELSVSFYIAFGGRTASGNQISFSSDAVNIINSVKRITSLILISSEKAPDDKDVKRYQGFEQFSEGICDLAFGTPGDMRKLGECGFKWEILPAPALNETSGYILASRPNLPLIAASDTSESIDVVGIILHALNESSYKCFYGEMRNEATLKYITSINTLYMLEIICNSESAYDMGVIASENKYVKKVSLDVLMNAFATGKITESDKKYIRSAENYLKSIK